MAALASYSGFWGASGQAQGQDVPEPLRAPLHGMYHGAVSGWDQLEDLSALCLDAHENPRVMLVGVTCPGFLLSLPANVRDSANLAVHSNDPVFREITGRLLPNCRLVHGPVADMEPGDLDLLYLNNKITRQMPAEYWVSAERNNGRESVNNASRAAALWARRMTARGGFFFVALNRREWLGATHRERYAAMLHRGADLAAALVPEDAAGAYLKLLFRRRESPDMESVAPYGDEVAFAANRGGLTHVHLGDQAGFLRSIGEAGLFAETGAPREIRARARVNGYCTDGREIWYSDLGRLEHIGFDNGRERDEMLSAIGLVESCRGFLGARHGEDPEAFEAARAALRAAYDAHRESFGPIRRSGHLDRRFRRSRDLTYLWALEREDASPSAIFGWERAANDLPSGLGAEDALLESRRRAGGVDIALIAQMMGVSQEMAAAALRDHIVYDPAGGRMAPRTEYIAGDVVGKAEAVGAAIAALENRIGALDPETEEGKRSAWELDEARRTLAVLEEARPRPATIEDTTFKLGERWQPTDIVESFVREYLNGHPIEALEYRNGRWRLTTGDRPRRFRDPLEKAGKSGIEIMRICLNQGRMTPPPGALEPIEDDDADPDREGPDPEANAVAAVHLVNAAIDDIHAQFNTWVRRQPETAARLLGAYNDAKNRFVRPRPDRTVLGLDGLSPDFAPMERQLDTASMCVMNPFQILYQYPGSGKTFIMITAALERMRSGRSRKALIVVPSNLMGQWQKEVDKYYPGCGERLRPITHSAMEKRPQEVLARLMSTDRGIFLCSYQTFSRMPIGTEIAVAPLMRQREEAEEAIIEEEGHEAAAGLRARIEELDGQIAEARRREGRADVSVVDSGLDYLVFDECDELRNLGATGICGLSINGNGRTAHAVAVFDAMREKVPGFGILMASGTLGEGRHFGCLWPYLRYMIPGSLEASGEMSFAEWLRNNTEQSEALTPTPHKGLVTKTVLTPVSSAVLVEQMESLIHYLPQRRDDPSLPSMRGGDVEVDTLPINAAQWARLKAYAEREERIRALAADAEDHPDDPERQRRLEAEREISGMSRWSEMGACCPETRFVDPVAPQPTGKVGALVRAVIDDRIANLGRPSTTLVFVDQLRSTKTGFSVESWAADFAEAGIAPARVGFAHQHTGARRGAFLERVRGGHYDVVIATHKGLGVGTNIQDHISQVIHVSIPITTAPYNQSNNRAIRMGNRFREVAVKVMVVERSGELALATHLQSKSAGQNALWRRSGYQVGDASQEVEATSGKLVSEIFGRQDERLERLEHLKRVEIPQAEAAAKSQEIRNQRLRMELPHLKASLSDMARWVIEGEGAAAGPEAERTARILDACDPEFESIVLLGREYNGRISERKRLTEPGEGGRSVMDAIRERAAGIRAMEPEARDAEIARIRQASRAGESGGEIDPGVLEAYPGFGWAEMRMLAGVAMDLDNPVEDCAALMLERYIGSRSTGARAAGERIAALADSYGTEHGARLAPPMETIGTIGRAKIKLGRPTTGSRFDVEVRFSTSRDESFAGPYSLYRDGHYVTGAALVQGLRHRLGQFRSAVAQAGRRCAELRAQIASYERMLDEPSDHPARLAALRAERDEVIRDLAANPPEQPDDDPSVPVAGPDEWLAFAHGQRERYVAAAARFADRHGLGEIRVAADIERIPRNLLPPGNAPAAAPGPEEIRDAAVVQRAEAEGQRGAAPDGGGGRAAAEAGPVDFAPAEAEETDALTVSAGGADGGPIGELEDAIDRNRAALFNPGPRANLAAARDLIEPLRPPEEALAGLDALDSHPLVRLGRVGGAGRDGAVGWLRRLWAAAGQPRPDTIGLADAPRVLSAFASEVTRASARVRPGKDENLAAWLDATRKMAAELGAIRADGHALQRHQAEVGMEISSAVMGISGLILNPPQGGVGEDGFRRLRQIIGSHTGCLNEIAGPLIQHELGLGGVPRVDVLDGRPTRGEHQNAFYRDLLMQLSRSPKSPRFFTGAYASHNYATLANGVFGQECSRRGRLEFNGLLVNMVEAKIGSIPADALPPIQVRAPGGAGRAVSCAEAAAAKWREILRHRRTENRHASRTYIRQDLINAIVDADPLHLVACALAMKRERRPRVAIDTLRAITRVMRRERPEDAGRERDGADDGLTPREVVGNAHRSTSLAGFLASCVNRQATVAAAAFGVAPEQAAALSATHPKLLQDALLLHGNMQQRGRGDVIANIRAFMGRVCDGSFAGWRYTNEFAARQLAGLTQGQVETWRTNGLYRGPDGILVLETDDPEEVIDVGVPKGRIPASCQRAGGGGYNQCLMAYVLDANKKVFLAYRETRAEGGAVTREYLARTVAKLAGPADGRALVLQGIYGCDEGGAAIRAAMGMKAASMGIPAVQRSAGAGAREITIEHDSANGFEYDDLVGVGEQRAPSRVRVSPVPAGRLRLRHEPAGAVADLYPDLRGGIAPMEGAGRRAGARAGKA